MDGLNFLHGESFEELVCLCISILFGTVSTKYALKILTKVIYQMSRTDDHAVQCGGGWWVWQCQCGRMR
jgi:hypothetical protein